ncbi:YjgN family protein [Vibrio sp. WXL210]|uniref:YjgN family protein n=1 Tax=Vibrio sp. WXL210 TaxID=3450709 RepID=UPI003EC702F4
MDKEVCVNPLGFKGQGREFFGIWIVNILLSIVTLGIYSAWAKVRTKRYFYGNTFVAGDSFEYHATPMQILRGRLIAVGLMIVLLLGNVLFPVLSGLLVLLFYIALPWLLWSSIRFNAAMTSYRNVRFAFTASLKDAYKVMFGRGFIALLAILGFMFLMILTVEFMAGAFIPLTIVAVVGSPALYAWVLAGVYRYFANGYSYGDWRASAQVENGFFVRTFYKVAVLGVIAALVGVTFAYIPMFNMTGNPIVMVASSYLGTLTVMIILTAYLKVRTRNYIFSRLVVEQNDSQESPLSSCDAQTQETESKSNKFGLDSTFTVPSYCKLVVTNFLLQLFSLGIARPWVMVRTARYTTENTVVLGDMSQLVASDINAQPKSAVTDEVSQAFDVDFGLG